MRSTTVIAWLLLVASPVAGLAQDMPGIDLSAPPKQKAPSKDAPPPDEGEVLPPVDLSAPPAKPARPAEPAKPQGEAVSPLGPSGERDVALGDRVKAVQRKGFLKRGRLELAPIFSATLNDAFYEKFGYGARLAYDLQDSFGVAVRYLQYTPYRTDNVTEGRKALNAQLVNSQLYQLVMADGVWSPIYGKAAFLGRSIVHFDVFLQAGFGAVWTSTSEKPLSQGWHVAADLGGGVRFYPTEFLAFELGLSGTLYPDQPNPSVPGIVQKVVSANFGVTLFWPFSYEYYYP